MELRDLWPTQSSISNSLESSVLDLPDEVQLLAMGTGHSFYHSKLIGNWEEFMVSSFLCKWDWEVTFLYLQVIVPFELSKFKENALG